MAEFPPPAPRLIVFSDALRAPPEFTTARWAALAGSATPGSVLLILRDYELPVPVRIALGRQWAALAERTQQLFGIAERADLARALGAHALHLPEHGLTARDARRYLGPRAFLSRACHDPTLPLTAPPAPPAPPALGDELDELDALLLSPIFAARKGRPALGLAALRTFREASAQATKKVAL